MLKYYIVQRGNVIPATDIDTGPLIYRNDELFFRFQRWIVGLMVLMVCLAIVLALLYLGLYLFGDYPTFGLFIPIMWSVVAVLYIWQIHDWRQFKYGIGFHQKGIDIIKVGPLKAGRLFIPTKEIFETKKVLMAIRIEARFSNKRWKIPIKALDEQGIDVLNMLLADGQDKAGKPKLVVYSEKDA